MHLYTYGFTCVCVWVCVCACRRRCYWVLLDIDIETQVLSSGLTLELHLLRAAPRSERRQCLPPAAPVSVSFSVTVSVVACPILSSASFLVSCWFWINLFCSQVNPQSQSQPLSLSPYPMRCISGPLRHKRRQQKKTRERERETERKWRKKPSRGTSHLPGAGRTSGFATTPSAAAREWYMKYLMVWH